MSRWPLAASAYSPRGNLVQLICKLRTDEHCGAVITAIGRSACARWRWQFRERLCGTTLVRLHAQAGANQTAGVQVGK